MLALAAFRRAGARRVQPTSRRYFSELDFKDKFADRVTEWQIWWQKRLILLRGAMVRQRTIQIPGGTALKVTLSEAAGHCAFVALALSYSEKDVWHLRMYACSGIMLNLVFQYYRAVPLWIPLRWNCVFLCINLGMFAIHAKEDMEAEYIPAEVKALYYGVFKQLSMSKVDFLHLVRRAKVVNLTPGSKLVEKDGDRTVLYLVQSGQLDVIEGDAKIATIGQWQLVGERQWKNRPLGRKADSTTGTVAESAAAAPSSSAGGSRDVVAKTDCVVLAWEFAALDEMLEEDSSVALAFERLMSSDLQKKVLANSTQSSKYRYVLKGCLLDGQVDEGRRKLLQQYRASHGVTEAEHLDCLKEIGWSELRFSGDGGEHSNSAATPTPPLRPLSTSNHAHASSGPRTMQ